MGTSIYLIDNIMVNDWALMLHMTLHLERYVMLHKTRINLKYRTEVDNDRKHDENFHYLCYRPVHA